MIELADVHELKTRVGKETGISDWVTIDQAMIDRFAEVTGDRQWIHVDPERAARELPGGKTIAHGFLTLSLLPQMSYPLMKVGGVKNAYNYGLNKLRFTHPVPAGSRVRLRSVIKEVEEDHGGVRVINNVTVEIEGEARPALIAETVTLFIPA